MKFLNLLKEWLRKAAKQVAAWPWVRIGLIALCSFLALVLFVLVVATVYIENLLSLIRRPNIDGSQPTTEYIEPTLPSDFTGVTISPTDVTEPPEPSIVIAHEDLVHIMLVGQDRRPGESYLTRSDAMILCTVNKQTKTITLTSFMRDLYVEIPGRKPDKMNSAYSRGGMSLLRETMMENFGIPVDGFVEVDFSGFTQVVDVLGGVNIHLTQAEAEYLNDLHGWNLKAGANLLDGDQALQYSRIRAIGNDFGRTERQRKVINSVIAGCKGMSSSRLDTLLREILPLIATDLDNATIFNYALELFPLLSGSNIVQQRIPIEGSYREADYVGSIPDVLLPDMEINRQFLVDTLLPK